MRSFNEALQYALDLDPVLAAAGAIWINTALRRLTVSHGNRAGPFLPLQDPAGIGEPVAIIGGASLREP